MSREKHFKHGQLKAFVNDPFNWYRRHSFPVEAILSIRRQAALYGFSCTARYEGDIHNRNVLIKPKTA